MEGFARIKGAYVPTLTEVLESSSDARLSPCLLLMLIRLLLRGGRIIALKGRGLSTGGEVGGEVAISASVN